MARLSDYTKTSYSPEEIFGQYCHTAEYIRCPVDMAFEYASNVYSLEEFTFRVRDFHYVGGGLYKGIHVLAKDTSIYMHVDAYPDSRVVDHLCAWDQGDEPSNISEPRARTDRVWVGDVWPSFYAIHKIEAANMKRILEYRFKHG